MTRRSLFLATLALLVGGSTAAAQAAPAAAVKLGYINSAVLMEEAPGAREASEQFDQYLQGSYAEVQRMSEDLQATIQQYERQVAMLTAAAKTQREEEIRLKQQEYQTRVDALESQAAQRQEELVKPVMDRVNQVIEELRTEGGYAFIFDVAAGSIIAADERLDLTQEVLRRLRASTGSR